MLITYPVIKSEIQEDGIWDFTAIREIPWRSGMWGVCSFEELGVLQHARALSLTYTHTHTEKGPDDQLDAECRSASSVSVRHEPQKLCHTRPGDEPLTTDASNKCLSEKVKKKKSLAGYGVDGRRIRLWLPSGSSPPQLHPDRLWGHPGSYKLYPMYTRGRGCGKWS